MLKFEIGKRYHGAGIVWLVLKKTEKSISVQYEGASQTPLKKRYKLRQNTQRQREYFINEAGFSISAG